MCLVELIVHNIFNISIINLLSVPMQNAAINFVLGLSVGLVFAFMVATYMSGSRGLLIANYQRDDRVSSSQFESNKDADHALLGSALSHEDLDKINMLVKPVDFHDEHAHHGR